MQIVRFSGNCSTAYKLTDVRVNESDDLDNAVQCQKSILNLVGSAYNIVHKSVLQ